MILSDLKEANRECLGCGICIKACKANALEMGLTSEGFRAVNCDKAKCCQCGNCSAICPQFHYVHTNSRIMKYFAVRAEKRIAEHCEAGGAFYLLAEAFIRDNGYVCGVEMAAGRAGHIAVRSAEDLNRVLGAKYIEADPRGIFFQGEKSACQPEKVLFCSTPCCVEAPRRSFESREYDELFTVDFACHGVSIASRDIFAVRFLKKLEEGAYVLFSGTPCQVAALKANLPKDFERLITVDLLCGGYLPEKLFRQYIDDVAQGREIKIYLSDQKDMVRITAEFFLSRLTVKNI